MVSSFQREGERMLFYEEVSVSIRVHPWQNSVYSTKKSGAY